MTWAAAWVARDVPHTLVAQRPQIDTTQQMLTGTEQDGRDDPVQLIDECPRRYWRIVATPPPSRTSRPPAASRACWSAASMP
jgi:hypothetical protein